MASLGAISHSADAQETMQLTGVVGGAQKTLEITRATTSPRIDGILDDEVWAQATSFDDLHQYLPVDHGAPSEHTVVYVTFDEDNLYVAARMFDSEPSEIRARQLVQGGSLQFDDTFGIYIDPYNNKRTGYHFQSNPNSIRSEAVFETPTELNWDWEGVWHVESRTDEEGWTTEMVIPFRTLNFETSNPTWGFTVERSIPRKQEGIAWVSYNRQLNPAAAGLITGFTDVQQGVGLDVVPSVVSRQEKDFGTGITTSDTEPVLDVFYKFTPALTGVLTLNTDFSATEVDDRQINLSRFSLFFPEKRDFFLQDVDIFSFGGLERNGIPFFSRRIGLSQDGTPVGIDVGAKLTGRVGRWNIGVLDIQEEAHDGVDTQNLFVGRIAANVLRESSVGMIFTDGNPNSNLENSLVGFDFRYQNTTLGDGKAIQSEWWYQKSDTEGIENEDESYGFRLAAPNNEGWRGELTYQQIQENFNPALGFVNRSDVEATEAQFGYTFRPDHAWIRSVETGMNFENFEILSTGMVDTQQMFVEIFELETNAGDGYGLQYNRERQVLVEDFEIVDGVVIPVGDYEYGALGIEISGAEQRVLAPSIEVSSGDFFNGDITSIEAGIEWRPNNRLFFNLEYEYNDVELPAGDFVTRLIQVRANYAFNVRWSWVNLIQYDNESSEVGINSRLRWNPRSGQDFYLVVNHGFDAERAFRNLSSVESQISLKYTHTFRF
ncbi:MAG: hypothetical protein HKN84_16255 [Gammaproteobacteria bacterium]|nr:hypothetical protein [Gammaproteobacteria bacterium]